MCEYMYPVYYYTVFVLQKLHVFFCFFIIVVWNACGMHLE